MNDQEKALEAVARAVKVKREHPTLLQNSPKGESQSNGAAENAVQQVEDQVRCMKLGLEDRLRRNIPTNHPLVAWVVQYAGDLLSTYLIGHDGKTPIQRLTGKVAREEILEMGESVLYRSYQDTDVKLAARWHGGFGLGERGAAWSIL